MATQNLLTTRGVPTAAVTASTLDLNTGIIYLSGSPGSFTTTTIGKLANAVTPYVWGGTTTGGAPGKTYVPAEASTLDDATQWDVQPGSGKASVSGGLGQVAGDGSIATTQAVPVGVKVRVKVEVTVGSGVVAVGFFDKSWGGSLGRGDRRSGAPREYTPPTSSPCRRGPSTA